MKLIFTIALALSAIVNSALAAEGTQPKPKLVTNLHDNQGIHEDLIASQELIALGYISKLNITAKASGHYDVASVAKIQQCADNKGTDLSAKLIAQYKRGEIEKARIPTYMLHYSVIFAKANNTEAQTTSTADLIKAAREQGRNTIPTPGSKQEKS